MKTKSNPRVVRTYKQNITYKCPVRGTVTQEVDVRVYESAQEDYENRYSDPEIAALLGLNGEDLEEEGFHEAELN